MTKRRPRGVALISILVIGMCSIIFLLALAAIVTNAVRNNASNRWVESLRNASEVGIDYVIDQFNTTYPCPLDPTVDDEDGMLETQLPAAVLQATPVNSITPTPGIPNIKVKIRVKRLKDPSAWGLLENFSSIYSSQLDFNKSTSSDWHLPPASNLQPETGGGYRVVESIATNGVFSRTIRVVLKAQFGTPPQGDGPAGGSASTSQSYFSQPFFANSSLNLNPSGGSLMVTGKSDANPTGKHLEPADPNFGNVPYAAYDLTLSSNQFASIGGAATTTVVGNIQVASANSGSENVANIPNENGVVDGTVTTNGQFDSDNVTFKGSTDPAQDTSGLNSVLANADGATADRAGRNRYAPANPGNSIDQYLMAPIQQPSSPSTLASLSSASDDGTPLSGDYSTSGLSSDGVSSPITVNNSSTPTRFFIQDTQGLSAVDINSTSFNVDSTEPRNFQIWYEGNKPVTINVSGDFNSLIYAPNAAVTLAGQGTFGGAIVGKTVDVTMAGNLLINTDLGDVANPTGANSKSGLGYKVDNTNSSVITGWKPVTWQELSSAN